MVFNRYLVKTLSPRDCKMFVNADRRLFASSSFQSGSTRAFEKMTDEEYADYLSLLRKEFRADIRDNPKEFILQMFKRKRSKLYYQMQSIKNSICSHQV